MEKENILIISIVAIVAIIGLVFMTSNFKGNSFGSSEEISYTVNSENSDLAGQAITAVKDPIRRDTIPTGINANSCNADEICEANVVQASDVDVADGLDVKGITQLNDLNVADVIVGDHLNTYTMQVDSNAMIKGDLTLDGTLRWNWFDLGSDPSAYLCIDNNNRIYASMTPCVVENTTNTNNNQDVLNMLNKCKVGKMTSLDNSASPLVNKPLTCNQVCDYYSENIWNIDLTCIQSYRNIPTGAALGTCLTSYNVPAPSSSYMEVNCVCCSP
jgi:hypothetical protein